MEEAQLQKQQRPQRKVATETAKRLVQEADDATRQGPTAQPGGARRVNGLIAKIQKLLRFIVDDVVVAALKKVLAKLKLLAKKVLQVFDLDTAEKLQEAKNQAVHIAKEAGKQAVSAALITCLTALAAGAQNALSGLIESGKKNIVATIHGDNPPPSVTDQGSLFDRDPWQENRGYNRPPAPPSSSYSGSSGYSGQQPPPRFSSNPWDRV